MYLIFTRLIRDSNLSFVSYLLYIIIRSFLDRPPYFLIIYILQAPIKYSVYLYIIILIDFYCIDMLKKLDVIIKLIMISD